MKKRTLTGLALALFICLLAGCAAADTLLHLTFDEGSGHLAADSSGQQPPAEIEYQFLHAAYTGVMEPEWRGCGVSGSALLFDGCSTALSYRPEALCLQGPALTVSAWVAPRAFEWDDPEAEAEGRAQITAVAGQYSREQNSGLLLGYQRFGKPCVQVGTGDGWHVLWAQDARLTRGAWNHLAAVFDGAAGRLTLYVNGRAAGTLALPEGSAIAPAGQEKLLIGKNAYAQQIAAGTYNMFCGLMDEVLVLDNALDDGEAAALAAREAPALSWEDLALGSILTGDRYKTQYHGGPIRHWMNEPHAPLYYNGMYHLFFQSNTVGTYWRNICWGHLVSEDTVRWRQVADALVPTENTVVPDGVWSGGATLDVNGLPVLFFTAGNDSFRKAGLISNQNIGAAWPADPDDPLLLEWVISDRLAVVQQDGQGRPGEFRDPHVWRQDGRWHMLVCSGSTQTRGGTALLYTTDTLEVRPDGTIDMDWQYKGPVYEMADPPVLYGTSWELPILVPLQNRAGTIARWAFFFSPAPAGIADNKVYYLLGDFDSEAGRFRPMDETPRLLDYGSNVFTGPSVLTDPATGRVCMFSIMQDQRSGAEEGAAGWAHCVGLTRNLALSEDGTRVCVSPDPRISVLMEEPMLQLENAALQEANSALADVSGDLLYIRAVLAPEDSSPFGLRCKSDGRRDQTVFTCYPERGGIDGYTRNRGKTAPVSVLEGPLAFTEETVLEVFIDRSLVECFFNGDKAISVRAYGKPESRQVELFSDGGLLVKSLTVCGMSPIY